MPLNSPLLTVLRTADQYALSVDVSPDGQELLVLGSSWGETEGRSTQRYSVRIWQPDGTQRTIDTANQSSSLGGVSNNLLNSDTFSASDSFSFTSIDSVTTSDGGSFGQSAYQAGVFNNGSFALASVSNNSTWSDNTVLRNAGWKRKCSGGRAWRSG
jgi:hypothetical protein